MDHQALVIFLFVASLVLGLVTVGSMLAVTRRWHMYDAPNERSSHTMPTPRGGGAGLAFVIVIGVFTLASVHYIDWNIALVIGLGGAAISFLGFFDDVWSLSAGVRLLIQFLIAVAAVIYIFDDFIFLVESEFKAVLIGLAVLWLVWSTNLFNFMDGIDGIAGVQAATTGMSISALAFVKGDLGWELIGALLSGSALGFLVFNWQPARIFMGDVGSAFLGFIIGALILGGLANGFGGSGFWLIIYAVFLTDSGLTLLRRVLRGANPLRAHREHAYQWASRRVKSHASVSLSVAAINILWLLPLALMAEFVANTVLNQAIIVLVAYLPLLVLAFLLGAGASEELDSSRGP